MGRLFYTKKSVVIRGRKFCYKLTVYSWLIPVINNFSLLHFTRELSLMDVLDSLCQRTKLCHTRAGPDFPYLKGAKSRLREVMDNLTQRSKMKLIMSAR